ncbi:sigma factor [Pseudomonas putida]|uniref:sigma factor n=1 Tax=Pseudomonas putida TaxID=303 RepID=UPI00125D9CC5|nr:sigma factor [Pseudomonas putida]
MQRTITQEALGAREAQLQALLLQGLTGDAAAYRMFLAALAVHVRSFLSRRLAQRPCEVEDLLQEVLLAVHNARHTYQAQQPLTAWVQAIARYKLADHYRSYARHDALHEGLEGLSVEETARMTGLSSSAVKVGIHRGLKALAKLMGGKGDDEDR